MIVIAVAAFGISAVLTLIATGFVRKALARRAILDLPNERSSHDQPTVRGAGLAVVPIVLLGWIAVRGDDGTGITTLELVCLIVATTCLGWVSWKDDRGNVAPQWRFLAHAAAAGFVLAIAPLPSPVFQGLLPGVWDKVAAAVLWVWFVNLFNFMDGIDGIAGVETIAVGLGCAIVFGLVAPASGLGIYGTVLAGAALGFLWWNWPPARIFLGDVGSIPLGFLLGWVLLRLASEGQWAAALILPSYYLTDATLTLARRALKGERVWRAHRSHFYQRAVQGGKSHAVVAVAIAACNAVLVGLAVVSIGSPLPAVAATVVVVAVLLAYLALPRRRTTAT